MKYESPHAPPSRSANGPDECTLVLRAQSGDQSAFEVLYERYNERICRYLSRMVGMMASVVNSHRKSS